GNKANKPQLANRLRTCCCQRNEREKQCSDDKNGTSADSIGYRGEQNRADQDTEQCGAEDRSHLGGSEMPVLDNGWSEIAESLGIKTIHDQAQAAKEKCADLELANLAVIEKLRNFDGLRL